MRFGFSLVSLGWILLGAANLSPALANQHDVKKPMEFSIVRWDSQACDPQCPEWIAAQGRIDGGSFTALQKIIQSLKGRKLPILIDSIGGDVDVGLKMGQLIRDKGFDVVVAKTLLANKCRPNEGDCIKQARTDRGPRRALYSVQQSKCASSCTFVLAGGVRRVAMTGARIGVHQVTVTQTQRTIDRRFHIERRRVNGRVVEVSRRLISERVVSQKTVKLKSVPKETTARLESHFRRMGLAPSFFALTMATPSDTIRILSQSEVQSTRIGTDALEGVLNVSSFPARSPASAVAPVTDLKPFVGFVLLGNVSAELALQADRSGRSVLGSLRLMEQGRVIPSAHYGLTLDFYETFRVYFSAPQGVDPMPPLTATLDRRRLCSLSASSRLTIRLLDGATGQSTAMGPAGVSSLLPMEGIRAALCPR